MPRRRARYNGCKFLHRNSKALVKFLRYDVVLFYSEGRIFEYWNRLSGEVVESLSLQILEFVKPLGNPVSLWNSPCFEEEVFFKLTIP